MTLMSMSMILLAIVEDMPKFSISSSRKGRGSFSGIPLIGKCLPNILFINF